MDTQQNCGTGHEWSGIDCHVHVFPSSRDAAPPRFPHPEEPASLAQVEALARSYNIRRYVLTQPSFLGFDNSYLLNELADRPHDLRGVVWLGSDSDPQQLSHLARLGVAGLRFPMFYSCEMPNWDAYTDLVSAAASCGVHVELGLTGCDLIQAAQFVLDRGANVVVAHLGMFDSETGPDNDLEFAALLELAATGRIWIKLSAPYRTSASHAERACDRLVQAIGPERLLWGSDWPHVGARLNRITTYAETVEWFYRCVPDTNARRSILETCPTTLYRFPGGLQQVRSR